MDMSPEEYQQRLEAELQEWAADVELMNSSLWEHMKTVFRLRRETLMSLVMMDEEASPAKTQRLKGRFQEAEYFLTLAETMKEGAQATVEKLMELENEKREHQTEEGVET
jgi:hypothetical protein